MSWYLEVLKKFATFGGRARRKEYWMFTLINFVIAFCIGFVEGLMGMGGEEMLGPLSLLYGVAMIIPGLAVMVRRLHDTNRSGWWFWVALVPFVGPLVLIYFLASEGDSCDNQYGPDPKNPMGPPVMPEQPQHVGTPVG